MQALSASVSVSRKRDTKRNSVIGKSQGGRVGNVKQVGFEPRPEDSYRRCRRDMIGETVPDASSGDRKSSVTDGRQSGAADNQ